MFTEAQLLPLSALQHLLYCPRQCALIHLEQAWAENRFTAEGKVLHQQAHEGPDESRPGIRITRSLPVRSLTLGLTGQCDVVEFHSSNTILPVEYKRGKPKTHRGDEVQLCAQALCLEEMMDTLIPEGALYYGKRRRRSSIVFDSTLRSLTQEVTRSLHQLIEDQITPSATYQASKCDPCSLIDHCRPRALRFRRGAASWFARQLQI